MLSAMPSNSPPRGVRNASIASARRRVERRLHVPGQVPRNRADPARLERVDEAPEPYRVDDVDRRAVVGRLDPDRLDPPRGHPLRRALRCRVDARRRRCPPTSRARRTPMRPLARRRRETRRLADARTAPRGRSRSEQRAHGADYTAASVKRSVRRSAARGSGGEPFAGAVYGACEPTPQFAARNACRRCSRQGGSSAGRPTGLRPSSPRAADRSPCRSAIVRAAA